jgi:Antitoxin VbhA
LASDARSTPTPPQRTAAERARDTSAIVGSLMHEGYQPSAQEEAIHRQVAVGELTIEEAIELFQARAITDDLVLARKQDGLHVR